jgi:hypothetical protein
VTRLRGLLCEFHLKDNQSWRRKRQQSRTCNGSGIESGVIKIAIPHSNCGDPDCCGVIAKYRPRQDRAQERAERKAGAGLGHAVENARASLATKQGETTNISAFGSGFLSGSTQHARLLPEVGVSLRSFTRECGTEPKSTQMFHSANRSATADV